jgi:hypothetical protein
VVLLSPMELDTTMRMILQVPIWAQRVIYIQGSCLKDADLARARMNEAEACFVLAARNYADKTAAVSIHNKPITIYLFSFGLVSVAVLERSRISCRVESKYAAIVIHLEVEITPPPCCTSLIQAQPQCSP